jgi:hypothetical protein
MSRSIHTTRKSVTELEQRRFESEDKRKSAVKRAKAELERKRRIKRQVGKERRSAPVGAVRSGTEAIPIRIEYPKPFVFHAVSEGDIREILRRLPAEAVGGIDEIRLLLGEEFMLERRDEHRGEADPLTGRLGRRLFPGVYSGTILGSFHSNSGRVTSQPIEVPAEALSGVR